MVSQCGLNEKSPYCICEQKQLRSASTYVRSDEGFLCPAKEPLGTVHYIDGQRRLVRLRVCIG